MAPSSLATLLARKRKYRDHALEDALQHKAVARKYHFDRVGASIIEDLLSKNTKTSLKKLRRLGVLEPGEDIEELRRTFAEYVQEEIKLGLRSGIEKEQGEEKDDIEGQSMEASKAYESLVLSLAAESTDKNLRGAVVEAYGRHAQVVGDDSSPSHEEDQSDGRSSDDENEDSDRGADKEQPTAKTNSRMKNTSSPKIPVTADREIRQGIQSRDFAAEHLDLSVQDLDPDETITVHRKDLSPAPSEEMQAWQASGDSTRSNIILQVSKDAACYPGVSDSLTDYKVKTRLLNRWNSVHEAKGSGAFGDFASKKQAVLFGILTSFMDVLYPLHRYPTDNSANDQISDAVLLHLVNHILVSGDTIKKNNDRLEKHFAGNGGQEDISCQDQGFVRPKVLILVPFRHQAKAIIERLIQLALQETRTDSVKNKARFQEEYGVDEEDRLISEREKIALSLKPKQHAALFDGNCDDHFRIGIKMTRGSVRLYTDFYDSDILVASPLAISTRLEEAPKDEPDPTDFLSSIEISVLCRADVMLMQNWQHVVKIYDSLNRIPKQQHNTDIMRIRDWYIGGRAKAYRQNILLSSFESPEMKSLFSRQCHNHSGLACWKVNHRGVLSSISPGLKHVFERLDLTQMGSNNDLTEADIRFQHFQNNVWPKIREASNMGGQLIYVPSYFDFVKVRNYLRKEAASFVALSEYTTPQDMSRARNYFSDKRRRVLVYTERAQFYNRHRIRGIKDVYYYQLPEHPQFYGELANFIDDDVSMSTINVTFTKRDSFRLQRIVGTTRAKKMLGKQHSPTFIFC
jgi:U3 small nucleolar RNA-associated protein 25